MIYQVLSAILETFLIYTVGAFAMRMKMMKAEQLPGLTKLALDVMMPMLTFAVITKNFTPENLNSFWIMPLAGFLAIAFGTLLGIPLASGLRENTPERRAAFYHLCTVNNFIYLPIIILQNMFPNGKQIGLLLIMNIGSTIGLWTLGVVVLTGRNGNLWQSAKKIISPNLIAVLLAMLCAWLRIPVPEVLEKSMAQIGNMCIPFSLLLIGGALYNIGKTALNHWPDAIYISVVRLAVIPAATVAILKMLPLPIEMYQTLFVVAVMPVSCNAVLMTARYGGSTPFTAQAILLTTILSAATIPLWMHFM